MLLSQDVGFSTLNTAPTPTPYSESGDFCDFVALPSSEVDALRLEGNIVPTISMRVRLRLWRPFQVWSEEDTCVNVQILQALYLSNTC